MNDDKCKHCGADIVTRYNDQGILVESRCSRAKWMCAVAVDSTPEMKRLKQRNEELNAHLSPWHVCVSALADEIDVLVRRHVIDARSPAADALLDVRNPPMSPRSDRIVALENELEGLKQQRTELRKTLEAVGDDLEVVRTSAHEDAVEACTGHAMDLITKALEKTKS